MSNSEYSGYFNRKVIGLCFNSGIEESGKGCLCTLNIIFLKFHSFSLQRTTKKVELQVKGGNIP